MLVSVVCVSLQCPTVWSCQDTTWWFVGYQCLKLLSTSGKDSYADGLIGWQVSALQANPDLSLASAPRTGGSSWYIKQFCSHSSHNQIETYTPSSGKHTQVLIKAWMHWTHHILYVYMQSLCCVAVHHNWFIQLRLLSWRDSCREFSGSKRWRIKCYAE